MHIIAGPAIQEFQVRHAATRAWLDAWWNVTSRARWERFADVVAVYPATDQVDCCLVFNVLGNRFRLIVRVTYANPWTKGTILVKALLTHAEYDKGRWTADCKKHKGRARKWRSKS